MALAPQGFVTVREARRVLRVDEAVKRLDTWQRLLWGVSIDDPEVRYVALVYNQALLSAVGACVQPPVCVIRRTRAPSSIEASMDLWWQSVSDRMRAPGSENWVVVCIAQDVRNIVDSDLGYQMFECCAITRDKTQIIC
jgi:hypothetical protein